MTRVPAKPKAELADQAARDRICHDRDTTLVVEAAAGTGKTTEPGVAIVQPVRVDDACKLYTV